MLQLSPSPSLTKQDNIFQFCIAESQIYKDYVQSSAIFLKFAKTMIKCVAIEIKYLAYSNQSGYITYM